MIEDKLVEFINNIDEVTTDKSVVKSKCRGCSKPIEMRLKQLKVLIKAHRQPTCHSCAIRNKWNDVSYRHNVQRSQTEAWSDKALLKSTSDRSKLYWLDSAYAERQKLIHDDPTYIEQTKQRSIDNWKNDSFRQKVMLPRENLEWKRLQSLRMLKLWSRPDYRAKIGVARASQSGARSSLELVTRAILGIEVPTPVQHCFSFSDLAIEPLDCRLNRKGYRSEGQSFLDSYHYAQFGRSAKAVYGVRLGGALIAVCKFSSPIRKEVATSMGLEYRRVLELDRFCIHPEYHKKNLASWILSRCQNFVFDAFPQVQRLVSFADMTYGHVGYIYKASNWTLIGEIEPDYYYVSDSGWIIHKKTLWNHASRNKMTEAQYVNAHGYTKVWGRKKYKYTFDRTRH